MYNKYIAYNIRANSKALNLIYLSYRSLILKFLPLNVSDSVPRIFV